MRWLHLLSLRKPPFYPGKCGIPLGIWLPFGWWRISICSQLYCSLRLSVPSGHKTKVPTTGTLLWTLALSSLSLFFSIQLFILWPCVTPVSRLSQITWVERMPLSILRVHFPEGLTGARSPRDFPMPLSYFPFFYCPYRWWISYFARYLSKTNNGIMHSLYLKTFWLLSTSSLTLVAKGVVKVGYSGSIFDWGFFP